MTDEYKENLLKELTGKVQGVYPDVPQFVTNTSITNDFSQFLIDNGHPNNCTEHFNVTRNNNKILFFTEHDSSLHLVSKFIVITDLDMTPIGIIDSTSGGSELPLFNKVIENDTGEGRIYFISNDRLYYINDPTSKKEGQPYQVEILNSYALSLTNHSIMSFKKDPNRARFIFGTYLYTNTTVNVVQFDINVGVPNEWTTYSYTDSSFTGGTLATYPVWEDTLQCRMAYLRAPDNTYVNICDISGSALSLNKSIQIDPTIITIYPYLTSYTNLAYITGDYSGRSELHYLNINTEADRLITSWDSGSAQAVIVNDVVFIKRYDTKRYLGIVDRELYYEVELGNTNTPIYILNSYNLYTIRQIEGNQTHRAYLIYNVNNYNGASYNGKGSVISNSAILFNSEIPVFARNLYNKTIVDNTEESTINVPTYMLNGVSLEKQQLMSKNNNIIIENTNPIEKNVYENVLINFFNEITIKDMNQLRLPASEYFVKGINEGSNVVANKYKVTYTNGDTFLGNISDIVVSGLTATLKLMFNSRNGVEKIEILSNDETTVYAEIKNIGFQKNKYFLMTQTITIGDD